MRHKGGGIIWGRISAAFQNYEHMAFTSPAILQFGWDAADRTMAMPRTTLEKMGGLPSFKDYVTEDVAMGCKAHDLGLRVDRGTTVDSPEDAMKLPRTDHQILGLGWD